MRVSQVLGFLATVPATLAATKGFNYGATFSDGSVKHLADYEGEFNSAKNLAGTGYSFASARLFTSVQGDTQGPTEAFQAAINTNTTLLVGLWASGGASAFQTELNGLTAAVAAHGSALTDLIVGISVGSEDVYRTTALGIASNAGTGATPNEIASYISQTRSALAGGPASSKPIGHVDTYNVYTNSSNSALISAVDFIGMDAYPYYETAKANSIGNANATFWDDYAQTVAVAQGKPVWITETGWPIQGPTSGQAVASLDNSATYYAEVGCSAFAQNINTWWFILQDQQPVVPASGVVFGVAGAGSPPPTTPLFSLSC